MKDQIALRIKAGDEKAFELLFYKYYVRLCGFANRFLDDPENSREVVQETFVKIWEGRENIDPEESLKSYLFTITKNTALNRLRRKKVESKFIGIYKLVYIENDEYFDYDSIQIQELEKSITDAISTIPTKSKRVFELSRIEGLTYGEIAETLKISVKTVETQMSRALQILRHKLKDYLNILISIAF